MTERRMTSPGGTEARPAARRARLRRIGLGAQRTGKKERARLRALSASRATRSAHLPAAASTARTRPGVIGASRMRTPVASKNAFATAAGHRRSAGSPEPVVREPPAAIDVVS